MQKLQTALLAVIAAALLALVVKPAGDVYVEPCVVTVAAPVADNAYVPERLGGPPGC